jgi:TPR repeat protein
MIEAATWYRAAAEAGHAEAQFALGRLYARGEGLPQQLEEAARWFEKAAEQGVAEAQVNIAAFHLQGTGAERDPAKAAIGTVWRRGRV